MKKIREEKMKKTIKKFFAFLCSLACFMGCLTLSACGTKSDGEGDKNNMNETPYYLIENSATDYKIVYPEARGSYIDIAVKELRTFLGEITPGITIKVSSDTGLTHSADAKYISLGDTALLQSAGISVDKEKLGTDGYAIITKDQSVYLVGGSTHGTLFAVYEFLEKQFGYHFYAKDCYDLERDVTEKKLLDFDLTVTPSIAVRYMADGQFVSSNDNESARRMRSTPQDDFLVPARDSKGGAGGWHTTPYILPKDENPEHPEWFGFGSTGAATQLCYAGRPAASGTDGKKHGKADQSALVDALVASMEKLIDTKFGSDTNDSELFFCLTTADNFDWCECEYCKEITEAYGGSKAASYIVVANKVAAKLQEYMNEKYGGRKITVFIFAYQVTEQPPVREKADGTFEPILDGPYGDDIILGDNVVLLYAPIAADYYKTFKDEVNEVEYKRMAQWKTIASHIAMWTYDKTFYTNYFVPQNPYNSMDENIRWYVENGAVFLHAQGQTTNTQMTDWGNLKTYLSAQLSWDCTQDIEELIDGFFTAYYKDAAPAMREWFDDYRTYFDERADYWWGEEILIGNEWVEFNFRTTHGGDKTLLPSLKFYEYERLKKWETSLNKAYGAIEKYKTSDPALYETLETRITRESVSLNYLIGTIYGDDTDLFTAKEKIELMIKVFEDAADTGLIFWREVNPTSGLGAAYYTVAGQLKDWQGKR